MRGCDSLLTADIANTHGAVAQRGFMHMHGWGGDGGTGGRGRGAHGEGVALCPEKTIADWELATLRRGLPAGGVLYSGVCGMRRLHRPGQR